MATSISSGVSMGADEPPGMTAFSFLSPRMPPAASYITVRNGVPTGSSYTPGLLTCPLTENSMVPPLLGVPRFRNQSPPFMMMEGP